MNVHHGQLHAALFSSFMLTRPERQTGASFFQFLKYFLMYKGERSVHGVKCTHNESWGHTAAFLSLFHWNIRLSISMHVQVYIAVFRWNFKDIIYWFVWWYYFITLIKSKYNLLSSSPNYQFLMPILWTRPLEVFDIFFRFLKKWNTEN